ncbi:hypothetical protein K466DRAFT_349233 [Polyporus arcularius HHB13444]|uniref:Uncharacterized protein n=1 Tax=Polyporus arcularius HHB13444 TaxID=1314778 RepID=A0A5C3NYP4_9APHY|nr:hypothetical protein K466DRAFT_349233 [Polyporus arcularius HHB13444]
MLRDGLVGLLVPGQDQRLAHAHPTLCPPLVQSSRLMRVLNRFGSQLLALLLRNIGRLDQLDVRQCAVPVQDRRLGSKLDSARIMLYCTRVVAVRERRVTLGLGLLGVGGQSGNRGVLRDHGREPTRVGALQRIDRSALTDHIEGGHRSDLVFLCDGLKFVHVDLEEDSVRILRGEPLVNRSDSLSGDRLNSGDVS